MTPERWERIEELFEAALQLPEGERGSFLQSSCDGDEELRQQVEVLLDSDRQSETFIEKAVGSGIALWQDTGSTTEGRLIGPYRLLHRIGFGGMGEVHLAERADSEFDQQVAIKLIRPGLDHQQILERFRRERQILASLDHPNIARLVDGGTTPEGLPYFVMEHIEGLPIDRDCDRRRLSLDQRLELFRTVCAAVRSAHQNLVVHRDLKPSNILITEDGTAKLLDFGIAKLLSSDDQSVELTVADERLLTLSYASPEQIKGERINTSSDVYSLGVVLYELLTGHRPFQLAGLPRREAERVVCEEKPKAPSQVVLESVPGKDGEDGEDAVEPAAVADARRSRPEALRRRLRGDLDTIVLTAMHKDPARRYSSPEHLADDIRRHLEGLPVLAHRDSFSYRAGKYLRRNWLPLAVVTAFLTLLAFSVVDRTLQAERIARENSKAQRTAKFLEDLFKVSDPSQSRGESITARELLDRGAERIEDELAQEPLVQATLFDTIGQVYYTLGLYEASERRLTQALERRQRLLGDHHPDVAHTLSRLGALTWATGDLASAEAHLRRALAIYEDFPEQKEGIAQAVNDLALTLKELGRYREAETLLREAIERYRELHGEEHPYFVTAMSNVALVLMLQESYDQAEVLMRETLSRARRLYGDRPHPETARYLNNLAYLLDNRGNHAAAEPLHRQALEIRRQILPDGHPLLIESLNNLGTSLFFQGKYREARDQFQEVVHQARQQGETRNYLATAIHNLAEVVKVMGDYQQAEELYNQALEERRRALGDEHPEVLKTLDNLAALLITAGDYDRAEERYEEVLALHEKTDSAPSEKARSLSNFALLKQYRQDYAAAGELLERALRYYTEALGEDHPEVARTLTGIAGVKAAVGELDDAVTLYRQAIDKLRRLSGNQHPYLSSTLNGLGGALTQTGQLKESETVLLEAQELRRQAFPEGHWQLAETNSLLGACLAAQQRFGEAEPLLIDSYQQIAEQRGRRHPMAFQAAERLVELYEQRGQAEPAARWRALAERPAQGSNL